MAKQTTCFDDNMTRRIKARIGEMAANHNRLLLHDTMAKLDMATALQTFIASEYQPMALATHRQFHDVLRSDAYKIKLHVDGVDGAWHPNFWWDNAAAYADPACFAVRPTVGMYDFQPSGFTTELLTTLEEYVDNAIEWGLVRDVFEWLNEDVVKPRDYAHLLFLMPALNVVLAHVAYGFAEKLGPPRAVNRAPVSGDALPFLQRANRFLSASCLLPETTDGSGEGPVYMSIEHKDAAVLSGWHRTFNPALNK